MNVGAVKYFDVANGPGVRTSIFVSGCRNHCKGCFQPETWDFNYGQPFTEELQDQILNSLEPDYISGLTLLGGDPFEPENQEALLPFLCRFEEAYPDKTLWIYTGYLWEDLREGGKCFTDATNDILDMAEVIVDGPFVEALKDIRLIFRGSSNQRIIDVQTSLWMEDAIEMEGLK